ncbi:hypothetical protein, partial [Mesorhizobium sp. M1C.F.Ca.ET.187.01.1.1]|uniref:hypothetical protein n=1 Tax=Mesorhizobium sp. M1C.F.Ca.ET.187.01.1.1 TaxID=2563923 RepID=UPI001AED40EF
PQYRSAQRCLRKTQCSGAGNLQRGIVMKIQVRNPVKAPFHAVYVKPARFCSASTPYLVAQK